MKRTPLVFIGCILLAIAVYLWIQEQAKIEARRMKRLRALRHTIKQQRAALEERYAHSAQRVVKREPQIIERLQNAVHQFEASSGAWHILLEVGDVYNRGEFPTFKPNAALAQDLYRAACMCPDGKVAGTGQSKYIESYEDPLVAEDVAGETLPVEYGRRVLQLAMDRIRNLPSTAFQKPQVPTQREREREREHERERELVVEDLGYLDVEEPIERVIYNDKQNVHDHGVTTAMKRTLDTLHRDLTPHADSRVEVEAKVLASNSSDKDKVNALRTLESLSSTLHSHLGVSETTALDLVWAKIQGMNSDKKQNVTGTLVQQLASGVEHGHTVCSSGKIARIVSTLDGLGEESVSTIRPMWAVREELATMAAQVRGTADYSDARADEMRHEFTEKATALYCDDLGMKESIVAPLIQMYASAF